MASPFGDPPPGIDLYDSHTARNNAVTISLTVLATVAVVLRLVARVKVQKIRLEADDWFIVAALVPTYAILACTIVGGTHGLGKHVWTISIDEIVRVNQTHFAYVLIYVLAIPLIKLSVISFYRRIFGMTRMMWLCVFLTLGYFIACPIAFCACCRPPSYYWTQYTDPSGGRCVFDLYPFYIGNAATNVLTDVLILVVPIPLVWKLQMRTVQKVLVTGIFLLGSFVCIASLVRIYYMVPLKSNLDVTWIMADVYVWSSVEPCMGILCACLPTTQPLFRRALSRILGSSVARNRLGGSSTPPGTRSSVRKRGTMLDGPGAGSGAGRNQLSKYSTGKGVGMHFRRGLGMRLRPEGDQTLLTTTATGNVEMDEFGDGDDGMYRNVDMSDRDGDRVSGGGLGVEGIQVKTQFQVWEEQK